MAAVGACYLDGGLGRHVTVGKVITVLGDVAKATIGGSVGGERELMLLPKYTDAERT